MYLFEQLPKLGAPGGLWITKVKPEYTYKCAGSGASGWPTQQYMHTSSSPGRKMPVAPPGGYSDWHSHGLGTHHPSWALFMFPLVGLAAGSSRQSRLVPASIL